MGIWPCCILGLGGIGLLLQHSNWSEKLSQHFPCEYFQKCFVFHISDYSTSNDNHLWNYRSLELVLSFQLIDQTALQNSHQFRSLSHRISWSLFLVRKPESIAIDCQKTQRTNSARWNGHSHISTIETKDTFWDVTEKNSATAVPCEKVAIHTKSLFVSAYCRWVSFSFPLSYLIHSYLNCHL